MSAIDKPARLMSASLLSGARAFAVASGAKRLVAVPGNLKRFCQSEIGRGRLSA
ncbi:MAG: hypothetical protein AVDCRST_MAG90-1425 [uncultured Microvirga sp.]|uniref:Uncharacterized protein n=1 Tax=uncultured Microvirga sp. TaxID=412392 RepID=A0A6J4LCS5_9HYPH|nr:MAG: hypothetical protein AVDCRST_MAG90-1425 [uncultured Microvirga sp.]